MRFALCCLTISLILGCDLPPSEIIDGEMPPSSDSDDTDTDLSSDDPEADTETDDGETADTETDTAWLDLGTGCLSAVMCMVTSPEETIGAISGSLAAKRGKITHLETRGSTGILRASVPLSEMFGYSSELRNLTHGRGTFTMHFEHYEAVPYAIAEDIIAAKGRPARIS